MPRLLADAEVKKKLKVLDGWRREGSFIVKTFEFGSFMQGIRFINRVAKVAEEQEHHPDISVRYTQITLALQTHSEGGVTVWDIQLAKAIDKLGTQAG